MSNLHLIDRQSSVKEIKANPIDARTQSKAQIRPIAFSAKALGFATPVLVDESSLRILEGNPRARRRQST